ncbi:MAG: hypothetical protein HUJ71_06450 [Pseudobutyrivibrio sp.]|nr:hypothetical protein [Pseudobutyrivibrio sp.]
MITFASVLYTQASEYLLDFIASVASQTTRDFNCLFLNDNYETLPDVNPGVPVTWVSCYGKNLTPQLLRIELLKEAIKTGTDLLIIGDADDTFSNSRIESIIAAYEKDRDAAFYYNDLVAGNGEHIFLHMPDRLEDVRQIAQGNFLGMSTTAINMKYITLEWIDTLYEGDTVIFDWYLYTRLLADFGHAIYVPGAATIYRIHDANEVGIKIDTDREYQVKLTHYANLGKRYTYFDKLYKQLISKEYTVNPSGNGYWWDSIKMEEQ